MLVVIIWRLRESVNGRGTNSLKRMVDRTSKDGIISQSDQQQNGLATEGGGAWVALPYYWAPG
jgi:hypothetical protein